MVLQREMRVPGSSYCFACLLHCLIVLSSSLGRDELDGWWEWKFQRAETGISFWDRNRSQWIPFTGGNINFTLTMLAYSMHAVQILYLRTCHVV
jgi:hypothetical protein